MKKITNSVIVFLHTQESANFKLKYSVVLIVALFLFFSGIKVNAQNHVWPIIPKAITFGSSITVAPIPQYGAGSLYTSDFPTNAMQDVNGNLLFEVTDGFATNGSGTTALPIQNPDASNANNQDVKGATEVIIVAVPGNCHKYYIISSEPSQLTPAPDWQPYYIRLNVDNNKDIQLQDANGNANNVASRFNNYPNLSLHSGTLQMAITPLRTATNDRLLFIQNALSIFEYLVTDVGITYVSTTPIGTFIEGGQPLSPNGSSRMRTELEIIALANGSYKLAMPIQLSNNVLSYQYGMVIYDVSSNGTIGSYLFKNIGTTAVPDRPVGIEFTPDGNYLYITKVTAPYLVAMNTTTTGPFTNFTILQDFSQSQIELSTNEFLYIAANNRLGGLSNITNPGSAIWNDPAPSLGTSAFATPGIPLCYSNAGVAPEWGIRYLPDQIDGEDYLNGFLLSDLHCCVDHLPFEVNGNYTVPTGTYTWTPSKNPWNISTPIHVRQKITIPTGANITMQDMTFMFGYEGAVEIQKGAVLTMLGTKFTNTSCDIMWLGVNILGTPGDASLAQNGVLSMSTSIGSSVIENAQEGVSMFAGGQLLTFNAVFHNNWHSINIRENLLPSGSLTNAINQSVFNNDGNLLSPHIGATDDFFISLRDIENISFFNTNTFTGGSKGIISYDSKYNLSLAHFTGIVNAMWSHKIYAGFNSEHIFSNNIFQNCFGAIRIDGGYNDLITDNIFNPSNLGGSQNQNYYGIQMESCGAFKILDNTFYHIRYGVEISNSGSLGGRISTTNGSGNQFISCWRGVNALGDNSSLQIKCNVFENIYNTGLPGSEFSTAWYIGGKLADQGSNIQTDNQSPAGNKFFRNPSTRVDLTSVAGSGPNGLNFTYYYHSTTGNPELLPTVNIANYINEFGTGIIYNPSQSCLGVNLMTLANNNPVTAIQIIAAELNPIRKQLLINELIYWFDTNNQNAASITYLESVNNKAAEKVLFNKYVKSGDLNKAKNLMKYDHPYPDNENINYVDFNKVLYDWAKKNKTAFEMKNSEENTIRDVSVSNTSSAVLAQGILNLVFGEPYLQQPSDTVLRLAESTVTEPTVANNYYLSPAYPNPTINQTVISYILLDNTKEAEIIITDFLGRPKQVFKLNGTNNFITVSTSDFTAGTYNYRLLIKGTTVSCHTFIVIK